MIFDSYSNLFFYYKSSCYITMIIVQCLHSSTSSSSSSLTHTHIYTTKYTYNINTNRFERFRHFPYFDKFQFFSLLLFSFIHLFISVWLLFLHLAQHFVLTFRFLPNRVFKHKNAYTFLSLSLSLSLILFLCSWYLHIKVFFVP